MNLNTRSIHQRLGERATEFMNHGGVALTALFDTLVLVLTLLLAGAAVGLLWLLNSAHHAPVAVGYPLVEAGDRITGIERTLGA